MMIAARPKTGSPERKRETPDGGEKRDRQRDSGRAAIAYFPFTSLSTIDQPAVALDFSQNGLRFESALPLKVGQIICIRTHLIAATGSGATRLDGIRSMTLAQVRWCREEKGRRSRTFVIGVSYC